MSASHSLLLLLLGRLSDSVSLFVSSHLSSINQEKERRKKEREDGQGESQAGVVGRPSPNHFLLLHFLLVLVKIHQ